MELTRSKIPLALALFKPVSRDEVRHYTRLIGALGLEAWAKIMQDSGNWAYSVAADASAQIHGVAYFSIRIGLVVVGTT